MHAALKTCSEGGIEAARLVFSVRRVMKNMKRPVLICISAKFALPAGMPVCLLWGVLVWSWKGAGGLCSGWRGRISLRHGLLVCFQYTGYAFETVRERILGFKTTRHVGNHEACCPLVENEFAGIYHLCQLL